MTQVKAKLIIEAIKKRRSVYPQFFNGERIPDNQIETLLEAANHAPTHKLTQPWRFIIYTGESLHKLSQYASEWYVDNTDESKYSEFKHNKTRLKALQSSHVIAIVMERHEALLPEWEEVAAVACAVQNLWIAAIAMGLGGYWSSPKFAIEGSDFFGLNKDQKCLGLFYLGIPTKELPPAAEKSDITRKIKWKR